MVPNQAPFDPLRPAPGEPIDSFRQALREWAGPVTKGEWAWLASLAGIDRSPCARL